MNMMEGRTSKVISKQKREQENLQKSEFTIELPENLEELLRSSPEIEESIIAEQIMKGAVGMAEEGVKEIRDKIKIKLHAAIKVFLKGCAKADKIGKTKHHDPAKTKEMASWYLRNEIRLIEEGINELRRNYKIYFKEK